MSRYVHCVAATAHIQYHYLLFFSLGCDGVLCGGLIEIFVIFADSSKILFFRTFQANFLCFFPRFFLTIWGGVIIVYSLSV